MGQAERLYRIEALLRSGRTMSSRALCAELEVSRATLNRDLDMLRERMRRPIRYDRATGGYRLDEPGPGESRHELPGLWFSSRELHALLAFHHFLETLEPGLLSPHIAPLQERLQALLAGKNQAREEITRRIRVLPLAMRRTEPACFQSVAHALLERKRLQLTYHGRGRNEISERTVSPQRLVHYRDNWYLDAWDHGKRALRTFAIERIRTPRMLATRAKDIPESRLDRHFASGYGIFAGKPKHKAVLRFSPERARWVADERWHPDQKAWTENGHYLLEIPYSDDRELVLDILKYGADVEVLRPKSLRDRVLEQLVRATAQYQQGR